MQGKRGADHEVCIPAEAGGVNRKEIDARISALDAEISAMYKRMNREYEKVIPKTGKKRKEAFDKVMGISEKYTAMCQERAEMKKRVEG